MNVRLAWLDDFEPRGLPLQLGLQLLGGGLPPGRYKVSFGLREWSSGRRG